MCGAAQLLLSSFFRMMRIAWATRRPCAQRQRRLPGALNAHNRCGAAQLLLLRIKDLLTTTSISLPQALT